MRRNLILFFAFLLLLGLSFWSVEKPARQQWEKEKERYFLASLLDGPEVTLQLPHFKLQKVKGENEEGAYWVHDPEKFKADTQLADSLFALLKRVKLKEKIEKKGGPFIPPQAVAGHVESANEKVSFRLGRKIPYAKDFYLEVKKQGVSTLWRAALELKEEFVLSTAQQGRSPARYQKLQNLFALRPAALRAHKIWPPGRELKNIMIARKVQGQAYYVDFSDASTTPAPGPAKTEDPQAIARFGHFLTSLRAFRVGRARKEASPLNVAEISVNFGDEKWQLRRVKDFYVLEVRAERANELWYYLRPEQAQRLLRPVQSFWQSVPSSGP